MSHVYVLIKLYLYREKFKDNRHNKYNKVLAITIVLIQMCFAYYIYNFICYGDCVLSIFICLCITFVKI